MYCTFKTLQISRRKALIKPVSKCTEYKKACISVTRALKGLYFSNAGPLKATHKNNADLEPAL